MLNFCPMCGTKVNKQFNKCQKCGLNFQEYQKKLEELEKAEIANTEIEEPQENIFVETTESESSSVSTVNLNPNMTAADFLEVGYNAYKNKNYEKAFNFFTEAENRGSVKAVYYKAKIKSAENDETQSFNLYQKAAESGCDEAIFESGLNYIEGRGVQKNFNQGIFLIEKAADNYFLDAIIYLIENHKKISKQYYYAKKLMQINPAKSSELLNFLTDRQAAFKRAYNKKDERCHFSFGEYDIKFKKTIFDWAEIFSQMNDAQETALQEFKNFYQGAGNIDKVVEDAKKFGEENLIKVAEVGIKACKKFGGYELTAENLFSGNLHGKKFLKNFSAIPSKIWEMFESEIRNDYSKIAAEKLEEFYNAGTVLEKYCVGIFKASNALKFRLYALFGGGNLSAKFETSQNILENLKKNNHEDEKAFEMLANALAEYPFNVEIYEYGLKRFGDPHCDFDKIAAFMSLGEKISELKNKILIENLKKNLNISTDFKEKILQGEDIVYTLKYKSVYELKEDFNALKFEIENLQPQISGKDKIAEIFEVYRNIINSTENDEKTLHKENRISIFEHSNKDFQYFELPEGITEIGGYAFANCKNLKKIKLPKTLKKIEAGAFYNCPLVTLELPLGVAEIAVDLTNFATNIYLPNSIEKISGNYSITSNLAKFTFDPDNMFMLKYFYEINQFKNLVSVLTVNQAKELYSEKKLNTSAGMLVGNVFNDKEIFSDEEFTVNAFFTSFIDSATFKNSNVKEIHFGSYLKKIGDSAFSDCDNLEKLILPAGTEKLGDFICSNCKNLKFLSVPNTVKFIGKDILKDTDAVIYCTPESFAAEYCRENNLPMKDGAAELYQNARKMDEVSINETEITEALEKYIEAAEMGNINAAYEVGKHFINAPEVEENNIDVAIFYFEQAANAGHKGAMFELYKIYNESNSENEHLAKKWLDLSGYNENTPPENLNIFKAATADEKILTFREKLFIKNSNMPCLYFPQKSEKAANKIKNAIKSYATGADDEIVMILFDDTLFGSATNGFLITDKSIYYHNLNEKDSAHCLLIENIGSISYNKKEIVIEYIETDAKIRISQLNIVQIKEMAQIIREIKNFLQGEEYEKMS